MESQERLPRIFPFPHLSVDVSDEDEELEQHPSQAEPTKKMPFIV